jgi:hypothetical protein
MVPRGKEASPVSALLHDLPPGPTPALEDKPRLVVIRPLQQVIREGGHSRPLKLAVPTNL